jgi:hypothetical protein
VEDALVKPFTSARPDAASPESEFCESHGLA